MKKDLYLESAKICKEVNNRTDSVRALVYRSSFKNKKQLLLLCCESLKYSDFLECLLQCDENVTSLLTEPAIDGNRELALILLYDFLLGKKLSTGPKLFHKLLQKRSKLLQKKMKDLISEGRGPISCEKRQMIDLPRYARINTLKTDMKSVLDQFTAEGYCILDECHRKVTRKQYSQILRDLSSDQVLIDKDVPNLLVFSPGTDLHAHCLVQNGCLILQDKSSCLASLCLNPEEGRQIFDICCAPGIKTSHLAALINNNGKIWSIDKDKKRTETAKDLTGRYGVHCNSLFCGDFLRTDVLSRKFTNVQYALLDPPCTGSGIVKRMDSLNDSEIDRGRLNSLGNLQAMLLRHALKLPALKRLVYSTCSVHERENEAVIDEVMGDGEIGKEFELKEALSDWKHRGKKTYKCGQMCVRASAGKDLTNGFFIALIQRRCSPESD